MDLLTAAEVAQRLGKSSDYWSRRAARREVPHTRIGRSVRWSEQDVADILAAARVDPIDPLRSQTTRSRNHRRTR